MKRTYLGAVCGEIGSYGIIFLDFPGCVSSADTFEEVLIGGEEALRGHIGVMLEAGEAIPDPSQHELSDVVEWLGDEDDEDSTEVWIGLYPVQVEFPEEANSVTIRMKADLIRNIADMAETTFRSIDTRTFIETAVEHELEKYRKSA